MCLRNLRSNAASRRLRAYIRYSLRSGGVKNPTRTELALQRVTPPFFFVLEHVGIEWDDSHPSVILVNEFETVRQILEHDHCVDISPLVQFLLLKLSDPVLELLVALILREKQVSNQK